MTESIAPRLPGIAAAARALTTALAAVVLALLPAAHADPDGGDGSSEVARQQDCIDSRGKAVRGRPLKYCGSLPSMARVNIRNAVLDVVYSGLDYPWAMEFVSDVTLLVSGHAGKLWLIDTSAGSVKPVSGAPRIFHRKQQVGLMDLALHPRFDSNRLVYLSHVVSEEGESGVGYATAVSRGVLDGDRLRDLQRLFVAGPFTRAGAQFGGALEFDATGALLLSTGDRGSKKAAQLGTSLFGKILRLRDDGSIPDDNPFVGDPGVHDAVYALGVRNPQGLHLDPVTGTLFETEHGPSGGDEINIIKPGLNYGWATISYGQHYHGYDVGLGTALEGMEQPLFFYLPSPAISSIEVYRGSMFPEWEGDLLVATLKARELSKVTYRNGRVMSEQRLLREVEGRYRDIKVGPAGDIFLLEQLKGQLLRLHRDETASHLDQRKQRSGQLVFDYVCAGCHENPEIEAPQRGARDYWQRRLKARPELYRIALEGNALMPARGLCDACTDSEIRAAVDYLIE